MTPPACLVVFLLLALPPETPSAESAPPAPLSPMALLLTLEVEDMDRDIGHQRETVASSRQRALATQKLGARGTASLDELEQEAADARYQEGRLVEMAAVRELKTYQRDILNGATTSDGSREYDLVKAVLSAQEATARVEADFRSYRQRQAISLLRRNAVSREYKDNVDVDAENAQVGLAMMRMRLARHALEAARRPVGGRSDPAEPSRREVDFLRATLEHDRHVAALAQARAAVARDRARGPSASASELESLRVAIESAEATIVADLKALEHAEAPPPRPLPATAP